MNTAAPANVPAYRAHMPAWRYSISLRLTPEGPEHLRAELGADALEDLHSQHWFDGSLRTGLAEVPMQEVAFEITPKLRRGGPKCEGFVGESTNRRGERLLREYPLVLFEDTVLSLVQEQIQQGLMQANQTYYYDVLAEPRTTADSSPAASFSVIYQPNPLVTATLPLAELRSRAKAVGTHHDEDYPVFFTPRALARAESHARRGAAAVPAVESGAALIGVLATCPTSREMLAVVTDALEATDAREREFSLAFTGETWSRLQKIVAARRQRVGETRVLGQAHGHNFLVMGGAPPCEACAKVAVCGRTNLFASIDDRQWMRAVMPRQPWQLCFIFGHNARQEQVEALYGLHDNFLRQRGYWVLDPADAERVAALLEQPPSAATAPPAAIVLPSA